MDRLLAMFDACESSTAYIHLPQDMASFEVLSDRLQEIAPGAYLELETLVNAHSSAATQEGFINGWCWAQATAKECLELRKLPELVGDYGPGKRCGNCKWFVQHFRYTGVYPWYEMVGCGHCMAPGRNENKSIARNPAWRGCVQWEPGE